MRDSSYTFKDKIDIDDVIAIGIDRGRSLETERHFSGIASLDTKLRQTRV